MLVADVCFAAERKKGQDNKLEGQSPEMQRLLSRFRELQQQNDLAGCTEVMREMQQCCRAELGFVEKAKKILIDALQIPGVPKQAFDALLPLKDDPEVKDAALQALKERVDAPAAAEIWAGTQDPDVRFWLVNRIDLTDCGRASARALSPISEPAEVDALCAASRHPLLTHPADLIDCLDVSIPDVQARLREILLNGNASEEVRTACAEKLGKKVELAEARRLLKELEVREPEDGEAYFLKKALMKVVIAHDPKLARKIVLSEASYEKRWYGRFVRRRAPFEIAAAMESLEAKDLDDRDVRLALPVLISANLGDVIKSAVRVLASYRQDDPCMRLFSVLNEERVSVVREVYEQAAKVLTIEGKQARLDFLLEHLAHTSRFSEFCGLALSEHLPEGAAPRVRKIYTDPESPTFARVHALWALRGDPAPESRAIMLSATTSADPVIRIAALHAMTGATSPEEVDCLFEHFQRGDSGDQMEAGLSLASARVPGVAARVVKMMEGRPWRYFQQGAAALKGLLAQEMERRRVVGR